MCNEKLKKIIEEVYGAFGVELAICEIFDRRWSYVVGTDNFISGQFRFLINENYGVICDPKNNQIEDIKKFFQNAFIE